MVIIKVLKRKDASSVLLAIVLGLITSQMLGSLLARPAGLLSGLKNGQYIAYAFPGTGWKGEYLNPLVLAVLQVIALEVLVRIYIAIMGHAKRK